MDDERKAHHLFAMNTNDAAITCTSITRQFKRGVNAKGRKLTACGLKKWLGFSEWLNGDNARIERGGRHQRTREGNAKAYGMASKLQTLTRSVQTR